MDIKDIEKMLEGKKELDDYRVYEDDNYFNIVYKIGKCGYGFVSQKDSLVSKDESLKRIDKTIQDDIDLLLT